MFFPPTYTMKKTKVGSVVQCNPNMVGNVAFQGALCVVTEVKDWGVKVNVSTLEPGECPLRLKWDEFAYVGEASWPDAV